MITKELLLAELDRLGLKSNETPENYLSVQLQGAISGLEVHNNQEGPMTGYSGFISSFYFDEDGNLSGLGAWE